MYYLKLLINAKKVLTLAGIEPGYPRLPICSADHSATRPSQISKTFIYGCNY